MLVMVMMVSISSFTGASDATSNGRIRARGAAMPRSPSRNGSAGFFPCRQRAAFLAFDLDQGRVDRGGEARIVELDREVLAIAVAGGLLPGGAELGVMWCTT